jgi:hypothetical protein
VLACLTFCQTIKTTKRVIQWFSKSTIGKYHLKYERRRFNVTHGLQKVGKTRFATHYHSGNSLLKCLPPIRSLCDKEIIKIPVISS